MARMQFHPPHRFCITLAAMLLCTSLTTDSFAAARKNAKNPGGKVKIQNIRSSSEESAAERDRRLYRECQGRPNSGACAGYTRKK